MKSDLFFFGLHDKIFTLIFDLRLLGNCVDVFKLKKLVLVVDQTLFSANSRAGYFHAIVYWLRS